MKVHWKVASAVAAGVAVVAVLALRIRPAPTVPPAPPVEVWGFAEFPEPLEPFGGGTLQVRLVDLTSADSAGLLIASTTIDAAPRSRMQAWALQVPASRVRAAEDAYFVFSLRDGRGLRYIGSGFPRELKHRPAGAPPTYNRLGIRLTAVPAP